MRAVRTAAVLAGGLLVLTVLPARSVPRTGFESCSDIIDGFGRVDRGMLAPEGLDTGGELAFTVDYAAATCHGLHYFLHAWRVRAPDLAPGSELVDLGTVEAPPNGAPSLTFELTYRDLAAVRDPFDERGSDRCLYVVAMVVRGHDELDRAPDTGMHVLCHRAADGSVDDRGGTQAPFQ